MPLWAIVLGGIGLVWWWRHSQATPLVQGALKYTVNAPASYYSIDPSTSQGVAAAGSFSAGQTVYSTVAGDGVFSNDSSYEMVQAADGNPVWVSTAALTQTS